MRENFDDFIQKFYHATIGYILDFKNFTRILHRAINLGVVLTKKISWAGKTYLETECVRFGFDQLKSFTKEEQAAHENTNKRFPQGWLFGAVVIGGVAWFLTGDVTLSILVGFLGGIVAGALFFFLFSAVNIPKPEGKQIYYPFLEVRRGDEIVKELDHDKRFESKEDVSDYISKILSGLESDNLKQLFNSEF